MHDLKQMTTTEDLSGTWCNSNAVTSSVMESISFVTPVLEKFFIRAVAEGLDGQRGSELNQRCLAFIREESLHSSVHGKLNASLLKYLGKAPPGLAFVESLLDAARKRLSLSSRLLIAAALEHFTAVLSKVYVTQESRLDIRCAFTRELFAQHAREELAHRSVVFDLWLTKGAAGRMARALTVFSILFIGSVYVSLSVPWILHRKTGRRPARTLYALLGFVLNNRTDIASYSPLRELFSFVRRDYHPDELIEDSLADAAA